MYISININKSSIFIIVDTISSQGASILALSSFIIIALTHMQTIQFYQTFISNPALLANGHSLIRDFLNQSPQNRSQTLVNILVPSPPILTLIGNVYPRDVYPTLAQQQKQQTRIYLLQVLYKCIKQEPKGPRSKNCEGVLSVLHKIHNDQGYQKWLGLYAEFIKNVPKEHLATFIIMLLKQADSRISTLSINIFSYIIQSIQSSQNSAITTQQLFQIFYYSIKSFCHLHGTDDVTLSTYFQPYKPWLINFIWTNIQNNPICMKYTFKILTVLYSDMGLYDQQVQGNIQKLLQVGIRLLQLYLNLQIKNRGSQPDTQIEQQDQVQDYRNTNLNSMEVISENIHVILCQLLQLYSKIIEQQQELEITSKILLAAIILITPSKRQLQYWSKNADLYLISIQDQFIKVIRNRANALVVTLVQEHQNGQKHTQIIRQWFGVIGRIVSSNQADSQSLAILQQHLNARKMSKEHFKLQGQFFAYQQVSYFILASTIETIFKQQQKQQLVQYLIQRSKSTNNNLIKIITLFICVNQLKKPFNRQLMNLIFEVINKDSSLYLSSQQQGKIGIILILAKGIGKLCYGQTIIISQHIPLQFVKLLVQYIKNSTSRPDENCSHIVVQVLLKLTQISPKNKQILGNQNLIDANLQLFMLTHFCHDGFLFTLTLKILEYYPYQPVVKYVVELLLNGSIVQEKYSQLIVTWLKKGALNLGIQHIETILQRYGNDKKGIITPIIKLYLSSLSTSSKVSQKALQLLNYCPDQTWLVPMLKTHTLINFNNVLLSCLHNITYEYTSQFEIQNKMLLPFYIGINQTNKFMEIINMENQLFGKFVHKLFGYSKLFQGQNLKIISAVFWIRLAQMNASAEILSKTQQIIKTYGKIQKNEWQDEQDEQIDMEQEFGQQKQEQNIIKKFMNFELQNQLLEKELEQLFKDQIWQWGSEYFAKKQKQLKQRL